MPITLRDYLTFPFNGGKGVRASQIADVDVPGLDGNVADLMAGRLGYRWYAAIRRADHNFSGDDFQQLIEGASSDLRELTFPEFGADFTFLGAVATPLSAPEAQILYERSRFVVYDLTADSGVRRWLRVRAPVYILGDPYRFYVSGTFLSASSGFSGAAINLTQRPVLSSYPRYAISTDSADFPDFDASWASSPSPVITVNDYSGARYLHLLLPHGTAPDPTMVSWAEDGAANIPVTSSGLLTPIRGTVHSRHTSEAPVAQPAGINRLVVLPERTGIGYWNPPLVFSDADLGFTYYGGFFTWPSGFAPTNPVDATVLAASETAASTTETITLPSDTDGGNYDPGVGTYVAFVAQPQSAGDITGIYSLTPFTSVDLATVQTLAAAELAADWQSQPMAVDWNGVMYDVWLNNRPGGILTRGQSGQRLYITRA